MQETILEKDLHEEARNNREKRHKEKATTVIETQERRERNISQLQT